MIRDALRSAVAVAIAAGVVGYLLACSIRRDMTPSNLGRRPRTGPPR